MTTISEGMVKRLEYLAEIAQLRNISLRMLMNQLVRDAVRFLGCEPSCERTFSVLREEKLNGRETR